MKKRDAKLIRKVFDTSLAHEPKKLEIPKLPIRTPAKLNIDTFDVFRTYHAQLSKEYFVRLYNFVGALQNYCFCGVL